MPDCYHVVNPGDPDAIGSDVVDCVRQVGGPGDLHKLKKRRGHSIVHAWTSYETADLARYYLRQITACLRAKGHTVYEQAVLGSDDELGIEGAFEDLAISVPGYEPGDDAVAEWRPPSSSSGTDPIAR